MTGQRQNRQLAAAGPSRPARRPEPRGMTLIELLVSTAILAMMILLVNSLLLTSRRTIEIAQTTIRANANARALVEVLRTDTAGMDRDGFLAIVATATGEYHLIFTTAGTYHSLCPTVPRPAPPRPPALRVPANAARIHIGLPLEPHKIDDNGTPADDTDDIKYRILYRRAVLHNPEPYDDRGYFVPGEDHHRLAATYYQFDPDNPVESLAPPPGPGKLPWLYADTFGWYPFAMHPDGGSVFPVMTSPDSPQPEMKLPVTHLDDLRSLWPYVVSEVSEFTVQWTDGRTDAKTGRLLWYDKDHPWVPIRPGQEPLWQNMDAAGVEPIRTLVEFNLKGKGGQPPVYCALWSYRDKNNWPKALRLMFKVGIPARSYEVVVDLPY